MIRRTLTLGLAAALTLAFATSAIAAPTPIPAKQADIKAAVDTLNVNVVNERVVFNKFGRQDLVLTATTSSKGLIKTLKRAFLNKKSVGDYSVIGYAHQFATNNFNFTFARHGERFIVEVGKDANGSRIAIWGLVRTKDMKPIPAHRLNRKSLR